MSARWRVGAKRWDWLRTLRCLLTGHDWTTTGGEQRMCPRCWIVDDGAVS